MNSKILLVIWMFTTNLQAFDSNKDIAFVHLEQCRNISKNTMEMNACYAGVSEELFKHLDVVSSEIKTYLSSDKKLLPELKLFQISEVNWAKYIEGDADLFYQNSIDGSIRNVVSLDRKIDLTLRRIYDLKKLYLFLFYVKITQRDLVGTWLFHESDGFWFKFHVDKSNKGTYQCASNKEVKKGSFVIKEGFLELKPSGCKGVSSEWIYLEQVPASSSNDSIQLQFLHGGGNAKERFNRIYAK